MCELFQCGSTRFHFLLVLSLRALQINLITTKNACVGLQHFYSRDSRFCLSAFIYIFFRFKFCFLLFCFFFTLDKMQVQLGNGRKSNFPVCMILWTPICPPNEYKTWTHAKNADCGLNAAYLLQSCFIPRGRIKATALVYNHVHVHVINLNICFHPYWRKANLISRLPKGTKGCSENFCFWATLVPTLVPIYTKRHLDDMTSFPLTLHIMTFLIRHILVLMSTQQLSGPAHPNRFRTLLEATFDINYFHKAKMQ